MNYYQPKLSEVSLNCNHQCLTNCPMEQLGKDCLWGDPLIGMFDKVEYPEFFWWRLDQIFGDSEEFLEITPNMMDEYFKEPDDTNLLRCPRCYSPKIKIGYHYIQCLSCQYNEPIIDFTVSRR